MEWLAWALGLPMIVIGSVYLWGIRRVALISAVLLLVVCAFLIVVVLNGSPAYPSA